MRLMSGRMTLFGALRYALYLIALLAGDQNALHAQVSSEQKVSVGDILVANEKLGDPNFARSVVLIVQSDPDGGTVGVILNRRTKIPVSQVFPKTAHATNDPVYLGGPVQVTAVQALLRLSQQTPQARRVMDDVYVSGTKELIEKSITSRSDSSKFRLYLGYAGWASGQLEAEIQIGAWSVLPGSPQIVFDRDPDSLWARLTRNSELQIAGASRILAVRPRCGPCLTVVPSNHSNNREL
ncbi:MAG: YqgE/AlgH family protein [Acidobacteriaceae bacterium]|nr:YqgE/AlgH family protein [Acidobacteriaceae bacterium]